MTHTIQADVETSREAERAVAHDQAPWQMIKGAQTMRQLNLDELRAVAGGPQIQNNSP